MPWQATGAGDVTILTAPGRRLCKLIRPDEIEDYDLTKYFMPEAHRLDGFDDILRLLEDLAPRSDTCAIRGLLKPEFATCPAVLRRIHDAPSPPPGPVIRAPFMAVSRRWLMIDFELPDCPPWVDPTDPLLVGGWLRQQLPEPFRCARCVVQLSNGAGFKPGLRCHLWFWLDTALDKPELDRLLDHVEGVDLSVFGAVQIHYTAAPLFVDVDDPVPERLVVLPGYAEVEVGEIPEPARPRPVFTAAEARPYVAPARGLRFKATRPERYMLACLRVIAGAAPGDRHPTIVRIATRLYGLAKAGDLDPRDIEARVRGAVNLSTFDRDLAEIDSALLWAWKNATPQRLP